MVADESPLHRLGRAARPAKLGITMDLEQTRGVWDAFDPVIEERRKRSRDQAATKTDASPPSEAPSAEVHRLYPQDDEGKEDA